MFKVNLLDVYRHNIIEIDEVLYYYSTGTVETNKAHQILTHISLNYNCDLLCCKWL